MIVAVGVGAPACYDAPTIPRSTSPSIHGAAAVADIGDAPTSVTIDLGTVDQVNGSVNTPVAGVEYPHPTVVRATLSGGVVTYTPNFTGIGPAQGPFGPLGRTALEWHDGVDLHIVRFNTDIEYILFTGVGKVGSASRDPLGFLALAGFRPPGTN